MNDSCCGFCGELAEARDLVRGAELVICRGCVTRGLGATLERTGRARDGETLPRAFVKCSLCDKPTPPAAVHVQREGHSACITCLGEAYEMLCQSVELHARRRLHFRSAGDRLVANLVRSFFSGADPAELVTSSRTFPAHARADLQRALQELLRARTSKCVGLHVEYEHETIRWASLLDAGRNPATIAPLAYEAIDIGESEPLECLGNTLWLIDDGAKHALLLTRAHRFGRPAGWQVELATAPDEAGQAIARDYFHTLQRAISDAPVYRGKVLSLDCETSYRGDATGTVVVHRLPPVARQDVILPEATLALLDRNVFRFFAQRDRLRELDMPLKKGLLFYGPPGTGKTHTIRYLASALREHTTLLITADEMGALAEYMVLARLLSPAIVVIEDVDLIARTREDLQVVQESLLNRLLNEMDGLRENHNVLFVLTTNRVETLESALAGRPGRIDQAIEFPLPDAASRRRLLDLYRRKLTLSEDVMQNAIERTEGMSAAFIKELMRRVALLCIERDASTTAASMSDLDAAFGELLFEGGRLNAKLLGAIAPE